MLFRSSLGILSESTVALLESLANSFAQTVSTGNIRPLLDWITKDENLHLTFGINLLLTILDENPELQTQEFAEEIRGLILQAVELEKEYNKDMLSKGILGLNADYVNQYVMHMIDRRLVELGFEPEYNVANPAKWMATADRKSTRLNSSH